LSNTKVFSCVDTGVKTIANGIESNSKISITSLFPRYVTYKYSIGQTFQDAGI